MRKIAKASRLHHLVFSALMLFAGVVASSQDIYVHNKKSNNGRFASTVTTTDTDQPRQEKQTLFIVLKDLN